jgi:membrane AbrB-like protein
MTAEPADRRPRRAAATLALGAVGGLAAGAVGLPLPWLIGALVVTGVAATRGVRVAGGPLWFPPGLRTLFVPVIGVLIGGAMTPEVLSAAAGWGPGLLAALAFVPLAHALCYLIFRRVGGLSRPTAYFAGMPGGLIEAIEIGEGQGADIRALTVLQFSRIAVVVTLMPLAFSAIAGRALGSAGGARFDHAPLGPEDAIVLTLAGVAGYYGARALKAPAAQITGPILASAAAHGFALTDASPPGWIVALAQLVIGVSLGLRFVGLDRAMLRRCLGLSLLSVAAMLALGAALSAAVAATGAAGFATMMLALAPGGVVEMGLVALSLNASPLFVTACHLVRIMATVWIALWGWRRLGRL